MDTDSVLITANIMRCDVIKMIHAAGSGHPGGSLSCCDILAVLFFSGVLSFNQSDPNDHSDDRVLLSKGHAAPALYAAFARLGWVAHDELLSLRSFGSRLQGHPDSKTLSPIEVCSGSLGQGLAIGVGLAYALLSKDRSSSKRRTVYVICGDGELQEGSVWEALSLASHLKLNNLVLLIDYNGLQLDGTTEEIQSFANLRARIKSFGWHATDVDGHDIQDLYDALTLRRSKKLPTALICHTVKGKGVSFMEGEISWHGKAPNDVEAKLALRELEQERLKILEGVSRV